MRFGKVALKWCRLDAVDGNNSQYQWRTAQRIFPASNNSSLFVFDTRNDIAKIGRRAIQAAIKRFQALRLWLRFARRALAFSGRFCGHVTTINDAHRAQGSVLSSGAYVFESIAAAKASRLS